MCEGGAKLLAWCARFLRGIVNRVTAGMICGRSLARQTTRLRRRCTGLPMLPATGALNSMLQLRLVPLSNALRYVLVKASAVLLLLAC